MILNIIHGDAPRIARVKSVLAVIHPKLVQRIKPFCEVPEREIVLYAYLKKIEFQDMACPYARTALRNGVRTMLSEWSKSTREQNSRFSDQSKGLDRRWNQW